MPNELGRRERRRLEIRDRLYTAAIELIVERGFEAATMDEIAERADVARATAFNHYPQKAAFLYEWGQRRRERVAEVMAAEQAEQLSAGERLRRYLGVLAELNTASRRATVTLMDASLRLGDALREPSLDLKLAELVDAGRAAGEFRSDVDSTQAGTLLAAAYFTAVLRWIGAEPEPFDLPKYLDGMLDMVLRGLVM
ncbi:TetR/AcrR family transcriptional regulator [Kutzneria sp. CA-103260]|uniref:TetR/AcrR family transcriptional regulator n=1 Tax=Kutzneria sp. CA-103260 TaxID=2802641 RepID=UPI001BAB301C|nr:TetR/AcrR family transcriptional regulator [Kutzneria sp. CA-103260]